MLIVARQQKLARSLAPRLDSLGGCHRQRSREIVGVDIRRLDCGERTPIALLLGGVEMRKLVPASCMAAPAHVGPWCHAPSLACLVQGLRAQSSTPVAYTKCESFAVK
mmetsp:Transcript_24932/g.79430  ORF Transcript_24932/g.79430 Transcript_24932/m.79430 type:complete len:108 (+) Transcript_24932:58-381(+)